MLFAAVSAFGQLAPAIIPANVLPPVGLVASETVQVNVADTSATAYKSSGALTPCSGYVSFYDASGSIIGAAATFTIVGGQIFSVALPYASVGAAGLRAEIRAEVVLTAAAPQGFAWAGPRELPSIPLCVLGSSIETYDSTTGVTHAFASVSAAQTTTTSTTTTAASLGSARRPRPSVPKDRM
jgi:hypothetical protein